MTIDFEYIVRTLEGWGYIRTGLPGDPAWPEARDMMIEDLRHAYERDIEKSSTAT